MAKKKENKIAVATTAMVKEHEQHVCRECAYCTPVTSFHTLTVKDRQPTLGRCPEFTSCVLLSQRACNKFIAAKSPDSV